MNKTIAVIGGPISQMIDPVLRLVPTGNGYLAEKIANTMEESFNVIRIGNHSGNNNCDFIELEKIVNNLHTDVVIFLAHVPNILVTTNSEKIRLSAGETGNLQITGSNKLIKNIKKVNPGTLLIPFKLADVDTSKLEIVKWMLDLRSAFAVYSRLGTRNKYWIIDALGNEVEIEKENLPEKLQETINFYLSVTRRQSKHVSKEIPTIPHLDKFVEFSKKLKPAFDLLTEKHVEKNRWPGNFSFRCSHGFFSKRANNGFVITKRNVRKDELSADDFVYVDLELTDNKLAFSGLDSVKPSVDAPNHRLIYKHLPWVKNIIHGHLHLSGDEVDQTPLPFWPCGAENQAEGIIANAPKEKTSLWVANITGHGFIALIGDDDPETSLTKITNMQFELHI